MTGRTKRGQELRAEAISSKRKVVRADTIVERAIAEYEALLDSGASELAIQQFLASHVYFWNGLLRMGNTLYSKIRLGDEYEIDFVICDPSSDGAEWHLMEIEQPTAKLLTKRGDPSMELTHALGQVREWQRWIERNPDYAQKLMPGIDHPLGHVFMGRRREIESPKARERLRAINLQNRANVEVGTLDRFAEQARSVLTWGPSRHQVRAKTHRELRAGLDPFLLEYVRSDMGQDRQFIKERRRRTRFDEDWARRSAVDGEPRQVTTVRPAEPLRSPIAEGAPRRARKPSPRK
jgi:hypothetical protein